MVHGFMTEVAFHTRPKAWLQHFSWNMKRLKNVMFGNKKANLCLINYDRLDKMCWCQNVHHPLRMGVCSHWDISTLSAYVCCIPSRGFFSLGVDTHHQPYIRNIKTASDLRNTTEVISVGSHVTTPTPTHCFSPFSVPWCVLLDTDSPGSLYMQLHVQHVSQVGVCVRRAYVTWTAAFVGKRLEECRCERSTSSESNEQNHILHPAGSSEDTCVRF